MGVTIQLEKFQHEEIINIAMRQSALDINCSMEDFLRDENVVVRSEVGSLAKKIIRNQ